MIKVSSGTLAVLGLADSRLDAPPTTAYLMVGGRCRRNCGFCAQARSSRAPASALSRVNWPLCDEGQVVDAVAQAHEDGTIERCCVQATVSPGHLDRVKALATRLGKLLPLSASAVASVDQIEELLHCGVERVGLSLDAASGKVFRRVKGGDLGRALSVIEDAAFRFPGRITTHLMVGLGETEEDVVRMSGRLHDLGVTAALFAFTPVRGTAMEDRPPPSLGSYRRMQIARYLLIEGLRGIDEFSFSDRGQVVSFGLSQSELEEALSNGEAFRTSGCPGCNRPYYNETPGGPLYNYPRSLTSCEAAGALEEALARGVAWPPVASGRPTLTAISKPSNIRARGGG